MAKLYRIIPDTPSTALTSGYITGVTEDLLYKLGYLEYNKRFRYYGMYCQGQGIRAERDKKFFYYSPWACIRALRFLDSDYGHELARILEYEIPDDILKASTNAFTNYNNFQATGKMVPIELLRKDEELETQYTDELRKELEEIAISDAKESLEQLYKSIQESKSSIYKGNARFQIENLNKSYFDPKRMKNINDIRFKESGKFFRTSIITGKSMIITRADRDLIEEVLNGEGNKNELSKITEKSNGMLSLERAEEYYNDSADHEYGMALSYD